jgi:hypothetical protein
MSGVSKKLMGTTAAGGGFTAIEDVFSTYLYTGNSSTQTITNGIDLAGEGGLVWLKHRSGSPANQNHNLVDTLRGVNSPMFTNTTSAQLTQDTIASFNSDGFSLGAFGPNAGSTPYCSWTFRKAPRFFDMVTYTGNGVAGLVVNHNLNCDVGSIFIKKTNAASNWLIFHNNLGASQDGNGFIKFNTVAADNRGFLFWGDGATYTAPTSSTFTLSANTDVNENGATYVAYLYAHDPLGPSGDGSDGLIACGSYTGNSSGVEINLGWEPQWFLCKKINGTADWQIFDTMRGMHFGTSTQSVRLSPNTSGAETSQLIIGPSPTGVSIPDASDSVNSTGQTYIYIAIRRGPMRVPESGTEVFALDTQNSGSYSSPPNYRSGFVTDAAFRLRTIGGSAAYPWFASRMTGSNSLVTSSTAAEVTNASVNVWDYMNGWGGSGASSSTTTVVSPMFRRAPNFFDVVAYTGIGGAGQDNVFHNLGVAPELVIIKSRSKVGQWDTLSVHVNNWLDNGRLNASSDFGANGGSGYLRTAPTDTKLDIGSSINDTGQTYIAYLFATLAGVSKVGSYTGNGSSQTINCGFTTGARFILIKRTNAAGDWYVWDTARGIVAGNDPHLSLNTTAGEVTTDDSVDPASSGFIVNQVAATNINVSAASYIFYAVA